LFGVALLFVIVVVEVSMLFAGIVLTSCVGLLASGSNQVIFSSPASVQRDYQGQLDVPVTNLKGLVTSS
jgi:hypothetical protein